MATPDTLQEAIIYFANPDNAMRYLMARRKEWKDGVECPTCGSKEVAFLESRRLWQCKTRHPKAQFSIKVGTIFEDSAIGLDKWLTAMWMVANCRNGVSSYEIHRALKVSQKSAWFMLHRLRLAMQDAHNGGKLSGEVEVDETYIGGKARNMHKERKARVFEGRESGMHGKTGIQGMVERDGNVRAIVLQRPYHRASLQKNVHDNVERDTKVFSDEAVHYFGLNGPFAHEFVNHAVEYVRGNVHTNTMENFWSLLKRQLHGTYVSVEPFHLFRYVDEQAFRYNHRKGLSDGERMEALAERVVGKRLTFAEVTGKDGKKPDSN